MTLDVVLDHPKVKQKRFRPPTARPPSGLNGVIPTPIIDHDPTSDNCEDGKQVSLEDYWAYYYEHGDYSYEYNDGILEVKPVANLKSVEIQNWLLLLLYLYLWQYKNGRIINGEIGFTMQLGAKKQVRKPDLAVIRHDNPVQMDGEESSYKGIFDLCIETVSTSKKSEIERDTVTKFGEYQTAKVKEYFLLSADQTYVKFYRLNDKGEYERIKPEGGVIRSEVLPGFQFRRRDLENKTNFTKLVNDPIYKDFVMVEWQQAQKQVEQEQLEKERERKARLQAEQLAEQERLEKEREREARLQAEQRASHAEQLAQKLRETLRAMGVDPDNLSS